MTILIGTILTIWVLYSIVQFIIGLVEVAIGLTYILIGSVWAVFSLLFGKKGKQIKPRACARR